MKVCSAANLDRKGPDDAASPVGIPAEWERQLAKNLSAQIPLQPGVEASQWVKTPAQVRAM